MLFNRIIKWFAAWPDLLKFTMVMAITIYATYYGPAPLRMIWYATLVVAYFFSKNEALWLAIFLTTSDGFISFFGVYSATLTILPGLPAVEISQIYILLSVVKAASLKVRPMIFYKRYMQVLLLYLVFHIIWGQMMGLTGGLNVYFRVLKAFIPMMLFYSIPRLFVSQEMYERFFRLVFFVVLSAFAAQLFTLVTGRSPIEAAGISLQEREDDKGEFRVFYNAGSTLTGLFGALYYLNLRKYKSGYRVLPVAVVFAALSMALLSATQGWIISFSLIISATILFTTAVRTKRSVYIILIIIPLVLWSLKFPVISDQLGFARKRLETVGAISEGDLTARGTLQRLDYRSQKALDAWKQNPLFGWGLSDKGYEYEDGHVGNQSLLVTSGFVGFILLNGFIIWFIFMMLSLYLKSATMIPDRGALLVFVFFLTGWFFIHSTSGQQFNFTGMPERIVPQAIFFSFGALQYQRITSILHGKKV